MNDSIYFCVRTYFVQTSEVCGMMLKRVSFLPRDSTQYTPLPPKCHLDVPLRISQSANLRYLLDFKIFDQFFFPLRSIGLLPLDLPLFIGVRNLILERACPPATAFLGGLLVEEEASFPPPFVVTS